MLFELPRAAGIPMKFTLFPVKHLHVSGGLIKTKHFSRKAVRKSRWFNLTLLYDVHISVYSFY